MRILAVTPYYEPEGGGLERYSHATLQRLARRGHEVHCVSLTRNWSPNEVRDGVHVQRRRALIRLGNTPIDPLLRCHLDQTIRQLRPDVVVAHTPVPFPAEMAYLAARKHDVPFVVTYHAGLLRGSNFLLQAIARLDRSTLERRMLAHAHRLIAVGPYVRDHALARHKDRVDIVPPGVDTEQYKPGPHVEPRSVLFVGPLSHSYRWKGLDTLWEAFSLVRQRFPDAKLTLVGDGDRFAEFQQKGHASRGVRLLGRLPEHRLIQEYQSASVLVLPSTTDAESFGMVLAEANACGRPVVASRVGGIPDFVRDGDNGLLAQPGDASDLAEKILSVLRDPDWAQEMGRRGRERVQREHNWDVLAQRTEESLVRAVAAVQGPTRANVLLQGGLAKAVQ